MTNSGFDFLGADDVEIGFDYMSLLSGAGGLLSGFGGGDKGGAAAVEKARIEEERRRAEQSASTMKALLIGIGALVVGGGLVLAVRR